MLHGLADSSDSWILNHKDKAPAFIAAEAGYDVWLPNARGNKYGMAHTQYDPNRDKEFWDHSWIEWST